MFKLSGDRRFRRAQLLAQTAKFLLQLLTDNLGGGMFRRQSPRILLRRAQPLTESRQFDLAFGLCLRHSGCHALALDQPEYGSTGQQADE
ncbi:hypothetical protein FGKAn22_13110 [Ferrigenium kumadai]|uniref:Uncharacterized protein n=1 Tax=Ferrigenium kumadai TaxID=1682490 RepID=A0AAN1VZN2_9PROT|nr:hypothetical protein FGKAn22_13110 [Ferrigenium kumadai]